MKRFLFLLFFFVKLQCYGQHKPYFKMLPPNPVSATYAVFHAAVLEPDSTGPFGFFYWINPNHQIFVKKYYWEWPSDSLVRTDTIFGLECNQKYYVDVIGFVSWQESPIGAWDSFYTLDTFGCSTGIVAQYVGQPLIKMFPNPVTDESTITTNSNSDGAVGIYDITGRLCKKIKIENGKGVILRADFMPGLYIYRTAVNGVPYTGKFIVQ